MSKAKPVRMDVVEGMFLASAEKFQEALSAHHETMSRLRQLSYELKRVRGRLADEDVAREDVLSDLDRAVKNLRDIMYTPD